MGNHKKQKNKTRKILLLFAAAVFMITLCWPSGGRQPSYAGIEAVESCPLPAVERGVEEGVEGRSLPVGVEGHPLSAAVEAGVESRSLPAAVEAGVESHPLPAAVEADGESGLSSMSVAGQESQLSDAGEAGQVVVINDGWTGTDPQPVAGDGVPFINPEGTTLEERILVPDGYRRALKEASSFQGYLRRYPLRPDGSPVLLYDGSQKRNQQAHAAVFAMPVIESDLQQCADSVMRMYAEYFWQRGWYDQISFHLTNGFLMDYPSWMNGSRLAVRGNQTNWVNQASYDASYETFLQYMRTVMIYAGTLSLNQECTPVDLSQVQAGDLFIKGGSPGHCVMVADVATGENGDICFLLAQGYMPAQEFHVLKNPLHEEDPWYYVSELSYPLSTPEYTFQEGSFKRWKGFVE